MSEKVNHPSHYNQVPGVECIDVIEHFNLNRGNAIKYIWRAGHKDDEITDFKKAIWYLEREIARIEKYNLKTNNNIATILTNSLELFCECGKRIQ